jgi:hypothetical protein
LWSKLNEVNWRHDKDLLSSACILDEEAEGNQMGNDKVSVITIPTEERFTALAWSLPSMISCWGGHFMKWCLTQHVCYYIILEFLTINIYTRETNGANFKLYALLGEAYNTSLPLNFILLLSEGRAAGGIQLDLTSFSDI